MKKGQGINKGKSFERLVAKLLTTETGVKWNRVPNSGGFATAQGVEDSRFQGDVFTENEDYAGYCVECKITGTNFNLNELFKPKGKLYSWWKQAESESKDKKPVLVFRYANSPIFLMTQDEKIMSGLSFKIILDGWLPFPIYLGVLRK